MQLDSKESDIEQLREKLNDLQQRMDNSSVTSLQTDETDGNIAGKVITAANLIALILPVTVSVLDSPAGKNVWKCSIVVSA